MQQTSSLGIAEWSNETCCLSSSLNRLRFPSSQRVGARGAESSVLLQRTGTHGTCRHDSRCAVRERTITVARNQGFTLIELMMVLTVISILVSIAI
ncbi:MAG: prepilin-type N-terminal cleavage/methylation domain-containing protein, partial [Terriglobia bacterium]